MAEAPLAEQAFARLRKDVLVGTFPAGTKLKVEELQQAYGFSSSPLREALSRLAQEGLVRADERRGFRVAPLSSEDLEDITRMRLMLDVQALEDAIREGDDAWEAAIVAAFHRLEKVESRLSDGPVILDDDWSALHRDFHLALIAACPSDQAYLMNARVDWVNGCSSVRLTPLPGSRPACARAGPGSSTRQGHSDERRR